MSNHSSSKYYTAVQHILAQISPSTLADFQKQPTDEDRFAFVSSLGFVQTNLAVGSGGGTADQSTKKSGDVANRSRQKGNELYEAGKLKDALACYTVSVLSAPVSEPADDVDFDDDEALTDDERRTAAGNSEFVLALGNRSACLLQMKRYVECLDDVDLALRYGYPGHLRYKLYDRRSRSLIELGRYSDAVDALQRLQAVLARSKLDAAQRNSVSLGAEKKINYCTSAVVEQSVQSAANDDAAAKTMHGPTDGQLQTAGCRPVPVVNGSKNERFPGASDAFDVRYQADRGRYGVATRDVAVGEVVLVESPYVSVLGQDVFATRCYDCFKLVGIAFGCHRCTRVRYCSEHCRKQSWDTFHQHECSYLDQLIASGTGTLAHLTIKLLVTAGIQRVLKHRRNPRSSDTDAVRQSVFTNGAGVYVGGYAAVFALLSHSDRRPATDLLQYALLAVWLTNVLNRAGFFDGGDAATASGKSGTVVAVGGVVLRFLQIIACNGVEVTELRLADNLHRSAPAPIGLALYPTVSLLNHSCDPLLELVFHDDAVAVRAIQNVQAGRELVIDYGYVYYLTAARQRRDALRSQYFFDCRCVACVRDWGLKSSLGTGVPVLRCTGCGVALPPSPVVAASTPVETSTAETTPETAGSSTVTCPRCGAVQKGQRERLEALQASQKRAETALAEVRKFRVDKTTMAALENHVTLIDRYVQMPWKDYVICLSTLKQCYRMTGNVRR